ncbi:hypothetical protein TNCV_5055941 [Trichonephila clavipes]|nr:hypothetical protein TNCV_5055941 [Trichonephila clavipes]
MSFTRRPGSGLPRQTSRREDRHIVRNARLQPTASSAAFQAQRESPLDGATTEPVLTLERRRVCEGLCAKKQFFIYMF